MVALRSRIAPTPSGYLHMGNLVNFLLVERLVKKANGAILLRIDDCDESRARAEYVEHIFFALNWLGINWTEGPKDIFEFHKYSQIENKDLYWNKLQKIKSDLYACECTRSKIAGKYHGDCRDKNLTFEPGKHSLRLKIKDENLFQRTGDIVLWRKEDGPAYHWVSVVDDLNYNINLIVRGNDLFESTEIQKYIAKLVSKFGFDHVCFVHHPLILAENNEKLSKSKKALSLPELIQSGKTAFQVREEADIILDTWGFK